jgi:hypothetical protein
MAQVKIYALRQTLEPREEISNAIHNSVMTALEYPADKKFHRFFPLEPEDFMFSKDRSEKYTILEISMFEGRSVEAKKKLIALLFANLEQLGILATTSRSRFLKRQNTIGAFAVYQGTNSS